MGKGRPTLIRKNNMKTRFVLVLVALASLAIIAPAQGTKKPAMAKKAVVAKKAAPVAKKVVVAKKAAAKKPVAKKATKPMMGKMSSMKKKS